MLSGPLVQHVHHCHLTLEVMIFITCKQRTSLLLFIKQAIFSPSAMYGIVVGIVNSNVLFVQTMLYYIEMEPYVVLYYMEMEPYVVMDDVFYRAKNVC